jgi:hypothetical protein
LSGDAEVETRDDELILDVSEIETIHDSVFLDESENRGVLERTEVSDGVDRTEYEDELVRELREDWVSFIECVTVKEELPDGVLLSESKDDRETLGLCVREELPDSVPLGHEVRDEL